MGNCFVKRESLPNNSPALYPDAHGPFSFPKALQTYETHVSSSSLGFNGGTCSSNREMSVPCSCSVNYTQISHDSAVMKTAIPEQVGSLKERSCKLAHLLEKSFVENGDHHPPMDLVTARISPILLSKSAGRKNSVGLEDPVHSKAESPRTKLVGLIVNQLVKSLSSVRSNSVRCSGSSKVDTFTSDMIFDGKAGIGISGCRIPKESPNLSSIFSRSSGLCRSCNLAVEGEKAFGSPLSIESNNLWERTRDCSPFDEFSDSSSDLFDIDFLKPTYCRGDIFYALK